MLVYCDGGARVESPVALVFFFTNDIKCLELVSMHSWYVFAKDIEGSMYL